MVQHVVRENRLMKTNTQWLTDFRVRFHVYWFLSRYQGIRTAFALERHLEAK